MKPKVFVSVPNQGWLHKELCHKLMTLARDGRYLLRCEMPTEKPVENNMHHILNRFMDSDFTHWLNIDSDNPPLMNPLDLVELDKDVIACPTPTWNYHGIANERPIKWNAYDFAPDENTYYEHTVRLGLQEVDAIGFGCVLFSRRVFENPAMRKAPFARKTHEDGRVDRGLDIAFCERAREQGFKIWAHYDHPCHHFKGEIDLGTVAYAINRLLDEESTNERAKAKIKKAAS